MSHDANVGAFGPLPGGSTILWQTDHFLMYMDSKGNCWRYMHEFHARWPVEFIPPITRREMRRPLTDKELEDLI